MATTVRVHGLRQLENALKELPQRTAKRVAGNAVRGGARLIASEAKARVPVDTGELKRSIVVRAARKGRSGIGAVIGFLKPRSRIAHLVEFGTSRAPAKPFLRPALDTKGPDAIRKIGELLGTGIEREAAKLKR